jgi:hypothetical protein
MLVPVEGGQYRFQFKNDESRSCIGIFHNFTEQTCDIHVYEEAFTAADLVPPKYVSLIGLPDLKRSGTRLGVLLNDFFITDRIYICFNKLFDSRTIQWRIGMRNLFRVDDEEEDQYKSFIGFDIDHPLRYINQEREYLSFKILLVQVFLLLVLLLQILHLFVTNSIIYLFVCLHLEFQRDVALK